ncbi:MAG TPA: S9 family peptidase [Thermoanaerobaculia bacterium]|nr:S9 family peptidase [Thermoanaerobaculia bacterium]
MRRRTALAAGLAAFLLTLPASARAAPATSPPMANKKPKTTDIHGDRLQDDYFWLRDRSNPEVRAYLEAENKYADEVMKDTLALQEKLYQEMLGRIKQTDLTVPYPMRGYFYYSRTETGKQYPIYCRKKGSLEALEQVLLDLNEMAKGERFMAVGDWDVSDDGTLLAYTTDTTGFRDYTLHVKDLSTGKILPDTVPKVSSVAWAADNRTLFYTTEDAAKRSYRLYRHPLGADPASDALAYEERDEMFRIEVFRSGSRKYLFLDSGSHTANEWRMLPADNPSGDWKLVAAREKEHEYEVDHRGDLLYIRTNSAGCRNFRLVTTPVAAPGRENWKEMMPCREDVMLAGLELFSDHMVLMEREDGLQRIRITDLPSGQSHRIAFPEPVYSVTPSNNREFETGTFRYNYQSLTIPSSIYDYDLKSRQSKLLKRTEVLGGYDPDRYQAERRYATASDGTKIPISLVYRKGIEKSGKNPALLYAYGSYGAPIFPTFNSNRVSLLDRGFVYAIAHIRGGGEMGKKWHDQGRMMNKKNTFTDFIACAEALIADRYTSKDRLVIEGGSAGGLLLGAVVNMRPDLFKAVVNHVPFVDVINTMLDESLPLTVGEFEEWGNPKIPEQYAYIRSYSPYDNIAAKEYPAMLVKTSFDDSQVMYWEPAKYVAKLRSVKTDKNPLIFKINMAGGHGGSSGRYDRLRETAFDDAFILTMLGIAP